MAGRIRSDAARQPGAAGANPAVFFRRSRFSICAPGLCAGNCSEARFWVRFCAKVTSACAWPPRHCYSSAQRPIFETAQEPQRLLAGTWAVCFQIPGAYQLGVLSLVQFKAQKAA